jgi:uncharacterized protein YidB (DUF937 family)
MSILDQIGAVAGQFGQDQPPQQTGIAAALMQALQQHPGGIGGLLQNFRQNGMSEHVNQWASGQQTTATPQEVQQGLNGTGLVENTAQKAGVSHEVAAAAIAALLPALIRHFAPGGQPAPQTQLGGLAQQFLSRML